MAMNSEKSGKKLHLQEEAIRIKEGEDGEFERYSVYVDNVDYWCRAQDVKTHFECCGTVNRITIPTSEFGNPMGYAYVEFSDVDSVDKALQLNGSMLRSRQISVSRKRKHPKWNRNNNNTSRSMQQPPPANSRRVGATSNRRTNNNLPIQQQRPPSSSSNSRFGYVRPITTTTTTASAAQVPTAPPTSSLPLATGRFHRI